MTGTRPPLEFTVGGQTIKMTYGLQLDIQKMIADPSEVLNLLATDPYLRDYALRRALTNSGKSITDEADLVTAGDVLLDSDEILELLDWVSQHLMYFFEKSTQKAVRLGKDYQAVLARLMPSTPGSEDSPSETPAAGPSDASKETLPDSTSDTPSGS